MKSLLIALTLLLPSWCYAAVNVRAGTNIANYPSISSLSTNARFIVELPGVTNYNIADLNLKRGYTQGLATVSFVMSTSNSLNSEITAANLWTNSGGFVRLTTNGPVSIASTGLLGGLVVTQDVRFLGHNSASNSVWVCTNATTGEGEWRTVAQIGASGTGLTNFVNLSVQAAKLPATNYPGIDGGNQNWEVLYYHTNAENAVANLSAIWQFVVPPDYATNTGKLHVQHTLIATNGPNSSNVVFTVDCVRSHSGDGVNLHTAAFGEQVSGTNTWAQSSTIVNAQADLVINLNTNLLWQAGDLVLMRLTRNLTNDTYRNTAVGLVGLQLEYTRQ